MATRVGEPSMDAPTPLTTTLSPLLPMPQQAAASAGVPFGYTPMAPEPHGSCKTCVPGTPEHDLLMAIPDPATRESWHNLLHYARVEEYRRNLAAKALPHVKDVEDWAVDGRSLYTSFNKAAQFLHYRGMNPNKPTKTEVERYLRARIGHVLTHDADKKPMARAFEALKRRSLPQVRHAIRKFVTVTGYAANGSGIMHPLTPAMTALLGTLPAGMGRYPKMMERAAATVPNPVNQNFIATAFGPIIPPFIINPSMPTMSDIQQRFSIMCNFMMFLGELDVNQLDLDWWNAYWQRRHDDAIHLTFQGNPMAAPLEQMKPSSIDHRKTVLKKLMAPHLGARASILDRVGKSSFKRTSYDIGEAVSQMDFHHAYDDAPDNQCKVDLAIAFSPLSPAEKRHARLPQLSFLGPYQVAVITVPDATGIPERRVFIFHGREALMDFANEHRETDAERYIVGDGDAPVAEADFNDRLEDLLRPSLAEPEKKTHAMAMKQASCVDLLANAVNEDIVRIVQGHVKADETLRMANALGQHENDSAFDAFLALQTAALPKSAPKCRGCGKRLGEKAKACSCGRAVTTEPLDPNLQLAGAAMRRLRNYLDYEERNPTELGQDALSIVRRAGGAKSFLTKVRA